MKKLIYLFVALSTIGFLQAQNKNFEGNIRRINTSGFAEKEVTPDIIYLSISLREYYKDNNSKQKVSIVELENQLQKVALTSGIKKEDFTIKNINSYNYHEKKKQKEILQSRQYNLKITDLSKLNSLFDKLDKRGINNTSIIGYDHSQKKEIERELKTQAVKDARENAQILAAADGRSAGGLILLSNNGSINGWQSSMFNRSFKVTAASNYAEDMDEGVDEDPIQILPIKLSSTVEAIFELK